MMTLKNLLLLALGAGVVDALKDSSPFILLSTSDLLSSSSTNIASATTLFSDVWSSLKTCPSDYYILATQPGVHASDYSNKKTAPFLRDQVLGKDKTIRSNMTVNEVVGILDLKAIQLILEDECGAQVTQIDGEGDAVPLEFGGGPRVIDISFPAPSLNEGRTEELAHYDAVLANVIKHIPSSRYTVLYVTSPREYEDEEINSIAYSSDEQGPLHQDLKRDYAESTRADSPSDNRSLFQKYQFLSPGIFMGAVVAFVLVMILYIGVSALVGLEVPYAAFEKDTSPNYQKKQQ